MEGKSLLIELINKVTPNSDLQPLLGAKASRELMHAAPTPLLLNGHGWERKEGRLSLAACSKKYSTPGLRPFLWTDT